MALLYNTVYIAVVVHVMHTQLKVRNCFLSTIVGNSGNIQLARKILQLKALGTRKASISSSIFDLVTPATT